MLPINKIYIDSRHKTSSSRSNSDFEIQLKEPINLPEDCICVVSDIVLKNTITTVEDLNRNLYVRCTKTSNNQSHDMIVKLDNRNYNVLELAINVLEKLNAIFTPLFSSTPNIFLALDDVFNNKILITCSAGFSFRLFTDEELQTNNINWKGEYYDKSNVKSCNQILGNYGTSTTITAPNYFISGNVNLQNLEYVLLSSFGLGYTSYGSRDGERHIIKKIPLPAYGEYIHSLYFDVNDFIPVHKASLTRLKFMLTDPYGNVVDLHGGNISFSLIFVSND